MCASIIMANSSSSKSAWGIKRSGEKRKRLFEPNKAKVYEEFHDGKGEPEHDDDHQLAPCLEFEGMF